MTYKSVSGSFIHSGSSKLPIKSTMALKVMSSQCLLCPATQVEVGSELTYSMMGVVNCLTFKSADTANTTKATINKDFIFFFIFR